MTEPAPETPQAPGPALGLYVHWPYCARICPYCDFNVARMRGREAEAETLAGALLADLAAQADRLGPRPLASIFFGGGTPSLMPPGLVARLVDRARRLFPASGPVEVTLEANPTDAEAARFQAFADAGVNRLSLGVQSLDDAALAFLGRDHSAAEARRAADLAARLFPRLSIDLIYARPGQTVQAWRDELDWALDAGFEHVSPYQLTIEPGTAFGRAEARGTLVPADPDHAADLYEITQARLGQAGFQAYEVSNHARGVAARSAHNLHVWRGGDYLGLGPGAHGRLTLDGIRTATIAHRRVADYVAGAAAGTPYAEQTGLTPREADEERVLLGLRTVEGLPLAVLARLGLRPDAPPINDLIADGFLVLHQDRLCATARGRPVLDGVLRALLA